MNKTEKRFWDKVDTSGRCWNWKAHKCRDGYGHFSIGKVKTHAHRFAYFLAHGGVPEGLYVCHHCDNPGCVKPSHLFLGTQKDNQQDSIAKGRNRPPKGERQGRSKLTENDVYEIRRLYPLGVTQVLLAKMWGISQQHVSNVIHRQRWSHI